MQCPCDKGGSSHIGDNRLGIGDRGISYIVVPCPCGVFRRRVKSLAVRGEFEAVVQ